MDSKLTFVVGMLVGALIGCGASYTALNKQFEKKLEESSKSLNDEYQRQFNAKLHEVAEKNREGKEKIAEKYGQITDILGYSERMGSDVPVEDPRGPVDILPPDPKPIDDGGPVYEISKSDFGDSHRKVNLNYYSVSGVLTDEDDMPIDDGIDLVSKKIVDSLDSRVASGLEDVYVRNEERGCDYRISLIDESSDS